MSINVASLIANMVICNKTQVHAVDISEVSNIDLELDKAMQFSFDELVKGGNRNVLVIFHNSDANQIRGYGIRHVSNGIRGIYQDPHQSIQAKLNNSKIKGAVKTYQTQLAKYLPTGRFLVLKDDVVKIDRTPTACAATLSAAEHLTLVMGKDGRLMVFEREYLYAVDGRQIICFDWES